METSSKQVNKEMEGLAELLMMINWAWKKYTFKLSVTISIRFERRILEILSVQ